MVSVIDIIIIIGYLLFMLLIGWLSGKKNKSQNDYFLAGRSMPWVPVALSVAATMISANGFIGGPGWAYESGMYPVMVNIAVPFAVLVALSVTTPVIYNMKITSVYQYVEKRFGKFTKILTILQFFVNSIIQISSMVFIPVLIIHTITGWSYLILVPVVVFVSLAYTLMGGIKAVIWTDSIQMIVVMAAVVLVVVVALRGMDLGFWDSMKVAKESGKLNTLDFRTDITITNTFWATLIGGGVMWIRYFCFDQSQVQRVLTAKSLTAVKNSFVVSAIIMNVVYFAMLFIGVILYGFYNGRAFETSNEIMVTFIVEELPVGAVGIIIAGVFAAAMSSVDSLLNSMTAVFTKDVYEPYFCKGKEATLKVSMLITVVIGILMTGIVLVGFNGSVKSVLDLVGSYISYFAGPAAGAFLLAMFTWRANDKGTAIGFIAGLVLGYAISWKFKVSWLWNPAIGATITIVFGYILSFFFSQEKKREEIREYTVIGQKKALSFGKQEIIVLAFFIMQYIFLFLIQF